MHLPMRPGDPTPVSRNLNPLMHPFARARERTRALNAAKMDRMFAKPFVDSLEGHIDAVEVLCRRPNSLTTVASGSWDGGMCVNISTSRKMITKGMNFHLQIPGIILHDLATRKPITKLPQAHKGKVSGLSFSPDGERVLSCGVDRNVKLWSASGDSSSTETVSSLHL